MSTYQTKSGKTVEVKPVSNTVTGTRDSLASLWEIGRRADEAFPKKNISERSAMFHLEKRSIKSH
jgi:hypothetical protein